MTRPAKLHKHHLGSVTVIFSPQESVADGIKIYSKRTYSSTMSMPLAPQHQHRYIASGFDGFPNSSSKCGTHVHMLGNVSRAFLVVCFLLSVWDQFQPHKIQKIPFEVPMPLNVQFKTLIRSSSARFRLVDAHHPA